MKHVRLIISGDVQGVGFRAWVYGKARERGITGWVKNTDDGSVEVVAEGRKGDLEALVTHCHNGPDVAWVEKVDVAWDQASDKFVGFEVVY